MAKQLATAYTFTPGGANTGTVVLTGLELQLEQVLQITNVTANSVVIFQNNLPGYGGTRSFGSGNTTITLAQATTGQNAADRLQIFYDDAVTSTTVTGTVTANLAAGTNNIGDVDVLTVPAPLSTTGNGTAATALRVTVASDSTGTIAATQSGTWNINNVSGTVSLPTGAATETTLSGLNTKVPSGLTVTSTRLLVDGSGVTQPVSGTVTANLGTIAGVATSANQDTNNSRLGDLTEAAPGTDTASSGLNGRLQRIAQRITSLIALFPTSLGQKTSANSLAVTVASDQSAIPASQSGTWNMRLQDGSGNAITSAARGSERAATVQIVDASGAQITSFGGSTNPVTYTETQLTAPGTTTIRSFASYSRLSCSYTIATINTNVVVRVEARLTGSSNWVNIDPSQADSTITANGTYGFRLSGLSVEDVRFNFVSETGGTAATIDVVFRFN